MPIRKSNFTSQAAQPKLVDLAESIWILPVVLDDINVIGSSQEASESRGVRIPERGRNDAYVGCRQSRSRGEAPRKLTILEKDCETLLHQQIGVQNNESEGERQHVIACSDLEEFSNCVLQREYRQPRMPA